MKIQVLSLLFVSTASSFTIHSILSSPFSTSSTRLNLQKTLQQALSEAEMICASDPGSRSCKVAWDIVEELKAADSHRSSYMGSFIDPNYTDIDTLLYSFDILVNKIHGKMDQLKATTNKMQELGATDPSVRELGELADHMKQQMAYVRNGLNQ